MNGIITVRLLVVKDEKDEGKPLINNHSQKFEIFLKISFWDLFGKISITMGLV